ncbi:hypothetical protein R6V09_52905, partial [Streptomyces sp. W16]
MLACTDEAEEAEEAEAGTAAVSTAYSRPFPCQASPASGAWARTEPCSGVAVSPVSTAVATPPFTASVASLAIAAWAAPPDSVPGSAVGAGATVSAVRTPVPTDSWAPQGAAPCGGRSRSWGASRYSVPVVGGPDCRTG